MNRQEGSAYKLGNVQIFKKQELGHGSYGAVYKAKCDALPCAAKLIYPVLFGSNTSPQSGPPQDKEHRQPMRRFEAECHFLSHIKHPNIVQYLGMHHDPETNAPVLLMELMDESLTHFLEAAHDPILFHIQVNILYDTALALAFLHTNGITHRDLSSNNVLLIAGSRAKVTDFGMSTLTDAAAPHLATMTQCPGTPAYMPPEALKKPPKYSDKLDNFSYGVLTVQVLTRKFPDPTDQYQDKELFDSQMRKIQARIVISELERRQSHISLIPATHPLQPIALDCLKDRDVERPTAEHLCDSMEQLKTTPLYATSIQQITERDHLLQIQKETIQDKEKQLQDQQQTIQQLQTVEQENVQLRQEVHTKTEENQQLQKQNDQQQLNQQLLERENQQLRQQVQSSEELIAEFQQGVIDKDRQIEQLQTQFQLQLELKSDQQQQQPEFRKQAASNKLKLSWKGTTKAPTTMLRGSTTSIGYTTYINPWNRRDVYSFHYKTMEWSTLTQCPYEHSTLTNINNKLTAVGGCISSGQYTNKLISYSNQKWEELYPPMPTQRYHAAVLSTTTHVVVIGGWNQSGMLTTVEILNIQTKQWSYASHLPIMYKISEATTTLCGEFVYLIGGVTSNDTNHYKALSCRLEDLVKQSTPSTRYKALSCRLEDLVKQSIPDTKGEPSLHATIHSTLWHNIPDLPVRRSTCVTVQGHVLAIGGTDKQHKRSSAIYRYDQQRNQWTVINNNMTIARSLCLATVLPDNNLLVVGGVNDSGKSTDENEIATVTII